MHSTMDLELVNYINQDFKWNPVKKGRRSTTRLPRKPGADGFKLSNKIQDPSVFEIKSDVDVIGRHFSEKISDAPLKKRRLLCPSPSPPPQTPCETPSCLQEDSGQQYRSNSPLKPTKNEVSGLHDFSGIELLAAAACSSLIHDNEDHVEELSMVEEHTKETIVTTESCLLPDTHDNGDNGDNGDKGGLKRVDPSRGVRFHWDLNTVMDEWEEPCYDLPVEPHSNENCSEGVNNDRLKSVKLNLEGYENRHSEVIGAEEREAIGTKIITSKTSDGECSASKSDVIDSLIHQEKHEDFSPSTTSVLQEQNIIEGESDTIEAVQDGFQSPKLCKSYCETKVMPEDPLSDGCGSNVTHDDQGHMADKVQAGYDSPFEDGELREQVEERDCVYYESDNIYEDDFGTIEDRSSLLVMKVEEKFQIVEDRRSLEAKEDTIERKNGHDESKTLGGNLLHTDGSMSFDVCRNGAYEWRSRSSNIGDSYSRSGKDLGPEKFTGREKVPFQGGGPTRVWDSKNSHEYNRSKNITTSLVSNQSRNYNPRGTYRTFNRKPSPSERNDTYSIHRGPHRGRSGFHPKEEHHDLDASYLERKSRRFSPNFNRSRSGSPIAWHFQKRKNLDTKKQSPDQKPSFSSEIDAGFPSLTKGRVSPDDRKFIFRRNQRFEPTERLKSDDHFRFNRRPGRFSKDDDRHETTRRFRSFEDRVVPESTSKENY